MKPRHTPILVRSQAAFRKSALLRSDPGEKFRVARFKDPSRRNIDTGVARRAAAAVLTLLLHVVLVYALLEVTAVVVKPAEAPAPQEFGADKLRGEGERFVSVDTGRVLATSGLACEGSSYVGLGLTMELGTGRIMLVGENTPASRAGLQHDDVVLEPHVWRDAHREGALLRLVVRRDGVEIAVPVLVSRICIG